MLDQLADSIDGICLRLWGLLEDETGVTDGLQEEAFLIIGATLIDSFKETLNKKMLIS